MEILEIVIMAAALVIADAVMVDLAIADAVILG